MPTDISEPHAKLVPHGHRWILFVSGPTASGKTSIAKYLAEKLNLKFVEGDDVRVHYFLSNFCRTIC